MKAKWLQLSESTRAVLQSVESRVTRLGEFSTIGWLFSLSIFLKSDESSRFGGYFFPRLRVCINFDKKGLGYIWAIFFTNSVCQGLGRQVWPKQSGSPGVGVGLDFLGKWLPWALFWTTWIAPEVKSALHLWVNLAIRGKIVPYIGGMFTPSFTPVGDTLYCLGE
jgi:hypothetical protein